MISTSDSSPIVLAFAVGGILTLIDHPAVPLRTALTGGASFLDALVLAPGMHKQQCADEMNHGEFPVTGAMTTGYVFRMENPATVCYLQHIGRTGHLVTARVQSRNPADLSLHDRMHQLFVTGVPATLLYFLCPLLTLTVFVFLVVIRDRWGIGVLGMFISARLINVIVIKRRSRRGWTGIAEPGSTHELLILLSQDRWVRLRGKVDDLKTVLISWMRELSATESLAVTFATTMAYASIIPTFYASTVGCLLIGCLLFCSAALLTLCNSLTQCLQMHDCVVRQERERKRYRQKKTMATDLVNQSGRSDWAVGMGLLRRESPTQRGPQSAHSSARQRKSSPAPVPVMSSKLPIIFRAAADAVGLLRASGYLCAIFGSAACHLYGHRRPPNDVDILVWSADAENVDLDAEKIKRCVYDGDRDHFFLKDSAKEGTTCKDLYYRRNVPAEEKGREVPIEFKVNIVTVGTMMLRSLAPASVMNIMELPLVPLEVLLLHKLQGWCDRKNATDRRSKQQVGKDANDIQQTLELVLQSWTETGGSWADKALGFFQEEFRPFALNGVKEFYFKHKDCKDDWRKLGFDVE